MLLIIIIAPKNVERAKHKPKEDVMDKSEESEHYSLSESNWSGSESNNSQIEPLTKPVNYPIREQQQN